MAGLQAPAQVGNINVTGKVSNDKGEPVPRASIAVKGSSSGTTSNENGNFQISVPANATLVISSVGFPDKEVQVNNQTTINVSLTASITDLDQVVGVWNAKKKRCNRFGSHCKS
jgi:hypothetical protein